MNDFEIKGVNIRLNKKLFPTIIKEKGFIKGLVDGKMYSLKVELSIDD